MAYQEVELTEEEKQTKKFYKFSAIGDCLKGVFLRTSVSTGTYAGKTEYHFKTKNPAGVIEEVVLTPPTDCGKKLAKSGLKPGSRVMITYTADVDTGKETPMKQFKVLVDNAPTAVQPPPPPPSRTPGADDDIPF